jgi:SAM-dependent methyltransferase
MRRADGTSADASEPRPGRFFEAIADHAGPAYLNYSFARSTEAEVEALVGLLELAPGDVVLDVGCGPGRHSHALARRGIHVVGIDVAWSFLGVAASSSPPGAAFVRGDVCHLPTRRGRVAAAICLCQGGFGLLGGGGEEDRALAEMATALRPGGRLVMTAFSSYFVVRHLEEADFFDADRGVDHERVPVRDTDGVEATFDLWTTCFTPRELRLMCRAAGLEVRELWSVTPGRLVERPPEIEQPAWLVVAEKLGVGPRLGKGRAASRC